MIEILQYRPPSRGPEYSDWKDEASCLTHNPNLFELGDPDEITEEDQQDLIAQGLKICADCPVRQSCKANSSELDRYWTTRGGQPPEGLFPDSKQPGYVLFPNGRGGGFLPGDGPRREPLKFCKRGHDDWKTQKRGKRFCATCKRETDRKSEAKRVRTRKS